MPPPIGITETRQRLRADRERLREQLAGHPLGLGGIGWLTPSYQAVLLHRWSHYLFQRGNRFLARLLWHLNLFLTGADISPLANIGGGFVLLYPVCAIVLGKAGRNLTLAGHGGFGGGMSRTDIGAGPGLPVLGDDVLLEMGAFILGPVRIGDGVVVRPGCFVTGDVPDRGIVELPPPRVRAVKPSFAPEST